LANFHAVSLSMKEIDRKYFSLTLSHLNEVVFNDEATEFYSTIVHNALAEALSSLQEYRLSHGRKLDRAFEVLKKFTGKSLFALMKDHILNSDDSWKAITHGDLWMNNIMFQHSKNDKVINVKLVDLQTVRYTNIVCDLLIFFYSSTTYEVRMKCMDRLIEIYHESLINNLKDYLGIEYEFNFKALENHFTLKNIKEEISKRSLFGLGMSLWLIPAVTSTASAADIESAMNSVMDSDKHCERMVSLFCDEYHKRIRDLLWEFDQRGYLSNLFIDV
jgi:Ecdysteroid kinase-like family